MENGNPIGSLLPFLLILVAFWFLILRPQRARARQVAEVKAKLGPGVEVVTTAGLFARVVEVHDDSVVLEVAPGVTSRYLKAAVSRIVPAEPEGPGGPGSIVAEQPPPG